MGARGTVIGVIGVGNMGGAMAARLLDRGFEVVVRDLDAAKEAALASCGARIAATPAALTEGCTAVVIAVVDAAQSEDVLFGRAGAAAAMAAGSAVILCPTIAPDSVERIAKRLAGRGTDCIDAPMSGGPARARDGSMSLMVACDDAAFERHRDVLASLSSAIFRVGERVGDGARTKLVNNLLAAVNLAGAAEALALAERLGLDLARTLDVIERSSGQSWIGSERMRRALAGDTAPRAHTTLLAKDSALALDAARSVGFRAPVGERAAATFAAAAADMRYRDLDDASLLAYCRGVERN